MICYAHIASAIKTPTLVLFRFIFTSNQNSKERRECLMVVKEHITNKHNETQETRNDYFLSKLQNTIL